MKLRILMSKYSGYTVQYHRNKSIHHIKECISMLSKKRNAYLLGLLIAGAVGNVAVADEVFTTYGGATSMSIPNKAGSLSIDNGVDGAMKAWISLAVLSNVRPADLPEAAANMDVSKADMNAVYIAALTIRDMYNERSRQEITKWCKKFTMEKPSMAVNAANVAKYKASLAALDTAVLAAVKPEIDKLSTDYPQAFASILSNTESFNLQSTTADLSSLSPAAWMENQQKGCMQFGS